MTVPSLITAELLLAGILLSLYLHTQQRSHFLKLLQVWLNSIRDKQRRQLRPNTPQDCPWCAAHSTPVKPAKAAMRIRAWTEQKGVQGRKKRVSSAGYACPNANADCVYFQDSDEHRHALVSDGWRGQRERIRQWRCQACGTRCSSRRQTAM